MKRCADKVVDSVKAVHVQLCATKRNCCGAQVEQMTHTVQSKNHAWLNSVILKCLIALAAQVMVQADQHGGDVFALLERSPYFIPGVSSVPFNFSDTPSMTSAEGSSGAFRVFGAVSRGLELNFVQAEQACRRIPGGKGLAAVSTAQRKEAIDGALSHSRV